jgi:hypothetical protein
LKRVTAVAFSPDGTRVLTGSVDETARLWDTATGKAVATLARHTNSVTAVAFSPDGTRVLTGSADNTARLWDAATGKAVATLAGHTGSVAAVAFSPDGRRILTGSSDNTARLWDAAPDRAAAFPEGQWGAWAVVFEFAEDVINTARTTVPRCLTPMQREAFHLGTPPPRWCYERNLWPFADHGQPYTEGGNPPYGPPAPTWDEQLLATWDRLGSWFNRSPTDPH